MNWFLITPTLYAASYYSYALNATLNARPIKLDLPSHPAALSNTPAIVIHPSILPSPTWKRYLHPTPASPALREVCLPWGMAGWWEDVHYRRNRLDKQWDINNSKSNSQCLLSCLPDESCMIDFKENKQELGVAPPTLTFCFSQEFYFHFGICHSVSNHPFHQVLIPKFGSIYLFYYTIRSTRVNKI